MLLILKKNFLQYVPRPNITPSNRGTTTTATTGTGAGGTRGQKNKVRQTMNGTDIKEKLNVKEEKQQQVRS